MPPTALDFRSSVEERPGVYTPDRDDFIERCGASFWTSLVAAVATRDRYKPFRSRRVAVGDLQPAFGKMRRAGGHLTVWMRNKAVVHPAFTRDAEAGEDRG
jgi:hypothetical protein